MFTLRSITAFDIAQGWVCLHDTCANQVVQTQQVLVVTKTVEVPSAERQSTKVLCDAVEQSLCRRDTQRDLWCIAALGVM